MTTDTMTIAVNSAGVILSTPTAWLLMSLESFMKSGEHHSAQEALINNSNIIDLTFPTKASKYCRYLLTFDWSSVSKSIQKIFCTLINLTVLIMFAALLYKSKKGLDAESCEIESLVWAELSVSTKKTPLDVVSISHWKMTGHVPHMVFAIREEIWKCFDVQLLLKLILP